jgi:DNA-binding PadR family transcriptional regulator
MPRNVKADELSPLAGALLGLLHEESRSGYALRKLFQTTPLRHFSDSPGSIYPALKRLVRAGLITGTVENARSLKPRQVFRLTTAGNAALRSWLTEPLTRERVAYQNDHILRFVFMPPVIGLPGAIAFLDSLERGLAGYVAELKQFYAASQAAMPLAGCLGLQSGIVAVEAQKQWARTARRALARQVRARPSRTARAS